LICDTACGADHVIPGLQRKLYNLGAIVFLDGDHETARSYFEGAHTTSLELDEINTRVIFDGFAALAADQGDYVRAARLSGAAESLGATIGYVIEPMEQKVRDSYLDKLRAAMTENEFKAKRQAGRNLTPEQARKLLPRRPI
jgi:hypothetical protein